MIRMQRQEPRGGVIAALGKYGLIKCCELKFENERTGRSAKIHLDQRTNRSV